MPNELIHTHAWVNAMDALDLKTKADEEAGKIYAGMDGEIIIFNECIEVNTNCGAGFGNNVKIFNKEGYLAFYAHLEKNFVKNGQKVEKGSLIGIEGSTGETGKNNRHLHISVHFDWRKNGVEYWSQVGWLPRSIPFKFELQENGKVVKRTSQNLKCVRYNFEETAIQGTKVY